MDRKPVEVSHSQSNMKKKEILEYVSHLKNVLLLERWGITIKYFNGEHPEDGGVAAECDPSINYIEASINIFTRFFELTEKEQKECLLHEMVHILTKDFSDLVERGMNGKQVTPDEEHKVNEQLVSHITKLLLNVV